MSQPLNRPENRRGLTPGSPISALSVAFYRLFATQWRALPAFRGKVRLAKGLKTLLGLDNHHILKTVTLTNPATFRAILDLHSWHELLAFFDGGYEADAVSFLTRCYDRD